MCELASAVWIIAIIYGVRTAIEVMGGLLINE